MDDYLTPPPGWHYSVHPWFALDDIPDLPELLQVGTVLLPEFFHLAVGTEGMWSEGWPDDDDFALFLHFHVFEGELHLSEAHSAGIDLPVSYEKFRKIVPTSRWKPMAVALMTRYLAAFMEEGGRPDADEAPAHGPRGVTDYESRPSAAMRWIDKLQTQAADAYAVARDQAPASPTKRKRNRITDEFLLEVAKIYLSADKIGLPPTREVANHFKAPHSTAAKWVGTARRKNFLPPVGVHPPRGYDPVIERRLELEWLLNESQLTPEERRELEGELEKLGGEVPGREA